MGLGVDADLASMRSIEDMRHIMLPVWWLGFGVWGSVGRASVLEEWALARKNAKQDASDLGFRAQGLGA